MSLDHHFKTQIQQIPEPLQETVEQAVSKFQEQINQSGLDFPVHVDLESSFMQVFCCSQFISRSCIKDPKLLISLSAIGRWVRAEQDPTTASSTQKKVLNLTGQDELSRLRKEVEQLRMAREILKKAAVFFAQELP